MPVLILSVAQEFVEAYMQCLNSLAPEVILSAAKYLPEFVSLCNGREMLSVLLVIRYVFTLMCLYIF